MMNLSLRRICVFGLLGAAALLGVALYMQHVLGLEPCPLCIMQRVALLAIIAVLIVAALHNPEGWGRRLYGLGLALAALAGLGIAGRQVWLQHLPKDQVPDCGPGLDYMLDVFPLLDALKMVFEGSGECAEVQWTFLGLSIPEWMLPVFTLFLLAGLYLSLVRSRP